MRIAFITSSLEPGKDGVGDYTRDLASSCLTAGCVAQLIALNDHHIAAAREEVQRARGAALQTLRLPASLPWHERVSSARNFLQRQPPDWVSLQFVCYGFHPKGMTIGLHRHLAPLIDDRPLHLMLHELWIGIQRGASLRERVVGSIQRRALCSLIAGLKPVAVHTSNAGYAQVLDGVGVAARVLPLCGSIPIVADAAGGWLEQQLLQLGSKPPSAAPHAGQWRFGFFGTLPELWSPEPLFTYIAAAAERAKRQVAVISIGRMGPGERLWRTMQSQYGQRFHFARLGERSREEVSTFLQNIDFGLATTPWQLIGKSASTAAMLDHGVPVIVSRDDVDIGADGIETGHPLLQRMDAQLPQWLIRVRPRPPRDRLAAMAAQFVADISTAARSSSPP